jgi:hypothetical protein
MPLKETFENHPVVWISGLILGAFGLGFGAYPSILAVAGRRTVSEDAIIVQKGQQSISDEEHTRLKASSDRLAELEPIRITPINL